MEFLSVRAAAERVGKSASAIRRLLYPIVKQDDHPDRDLIQPSVEEVRRLRMSGDTFPWKVSDELLKRVKVVEPSTDHSPTSGSGKLGANGESELLAMLRRELDIKNRQIGQQADLIGEQVKLVGGLSERLREGNVLIATLQQRLALTDGRNQSRAVVEANSTAGSVATTDDVTSEPPAKPRAKGVFARLFRRTS